MSGGWYRMHRGWMQSPDFKPEPFTEREAFIWSIEQAAHSPHLQWFNGVEIPVGRGEFATSSRKMATAFGWSEKRARLFSSRMQRRGKWTLRAAQEGAHLATILTVRNYERFQSIAKVADAANDAAKGVAGTQLGRSEDAQQKEGIKKGKEGKQVEASPLRVAALPFDDALSYWSEWAEAKGWRPVRPKLSDPRRRSLGKILQEHGIEGWRAALARAASSPLLGGPDPPAWFNFAFVIHPEKFLKTLEGNYDQSFTRQPERRASPWLASCAELSGPGVSYSPGHSIGPRTASQLLLGTERN